jgi:hypothetical protein
MLSLAGAAALSALDSGSFAAGGVDPALLEACLCRSHTVRTTLGRLSALSVFL